MCFVIIRQAPFELALESTMSDFINHYETLEVSTSASFETVERVFRYLAKRYHPDAAEHGDIQKFAQIAEAYEVLGDPEK